MNEYYSYSENDYRAYLEHHGILGMRWGVRRYQNKDGSLTAAGKKHVRGSDSDAKASYKARNRAIQREYDETEARIESKYKKGRQCLKRMLLS